MFSSGYQFFKDYVVDPTVNASSAAANEVGIAASGAYNALRQDNQPEHARVEAYRKKMEPLRARHELRKAKEAAEKDPKNPMLRFKYQVLEAIAVLENEIEQLENSRLVRLYGEQIRVKNVKKNALQSLLSADTMVDMARAAAEKKKDPEVVQGNNSQTSKLLNQITDYVRDNNSLEFRR